MIDINVVVSGAAGQGIQTIGYIIVNQEMKLWHLALRLGDAVSSLLTQ